MNQADVLATTLVSFQKQLEERPDDKNIHDTIRHIITAIAERDVQFSAHQADVAKAQLSTQCQWSTTWHTNQTQVARAAIEQSFMPHPSALGYAGPLPLPPPTPFSFRIAEDPFAREYPLTSGIYPYFAPTSYT